MCDRFFFLDAKELDNVNVYIYNEAAESALLSVFGTCRLYCEVSRKQVQLDYYSNKV